MNLIADANLPKPTIESNAFFNIIFKRDPKFKVDGLSSEESSVLSSDKSSVLTSDKILTEIRKNPKVTASQLAKILGISQRAVEKQIATLKKAGKIVRVGSKRSGHWKLGYNI